MTYKVNTPLFRQLIDRLGDYGIAEASRGARVSTSLLEKMYAGTYKSSPRENQRERLANFFNVDESELFQEVVPKGSTKAS